MSRASKRQASQTLARPSKKASDVKTADKFPLAQIQALAARPKNSRAPVGIWTLANIFAARDCQMRGDFERAARVAEAMRTFPPLLVARKNRLEAQKGIAVAVEPAADTGRGRAIASEGAPLFGEDGLAISSATASDIEGCLVDHGLAVGFNVWIPREDGTRVDVLHTYWPIEFIRRDPLTGGLLARTHDWSEVPVTHGDGRWVVYQKHEDHPERQDGAVLAGCLVWATGAHAWRDMAKASVAHGNAKVIGELPAGVALQTESGGLTDEASAMVELLRSIANDDTPIGIQPTGSKIQYLVNSSSAWQIFDKLALNAEKAAARIYLGTDGTLGSQGGAPGVDVDALFGVARTYIEGDLRCIERCFYAGVIVPWTAINFGDSAMAPRRVYQIPDVDQDAATDAMAKRRQAFFDDIERQKANGCEVTQDVLAALAAEYRVTAPTLAIATSASESPAVSAEQFFAAIRMAKDGGFVVDQAWVDEVAATFGIRPPRLPPTSAQAPSIAIAPTDLVDWITPNEVRASSGLGPMTLEDGSPDPQGTIQIRVIKKMDEAAVEQAAREADAAEIAAKAEADKQVAAAKAEAEAATVAAEAQPETTPDAAALSMAADLESERSERIALSAQLREESERRERAEARAREAEERGEQREVLIAHLRVEMETELERRVQAALTARAEDRQG